MGLENCSRGMKILLCRLIKIDSAKTLLVERRCQLPLITGGAIKSVICRRHLESLTYIKSVLVIKSRIVFRKKKDEYAFKLKTS